MMSKTGRLLEDILAEQGLSMGFVYGGAKRANDEIVDREIDLQPTHRAQELMDKVLFPGLFFHQY